MSKLEHALEKGNNLNILRLLAAASVTIGHCWPLTGVAGDPLNRLISYQSGQVGLAIFFTISGLLITRSAQRSSVGSYLQRRALRILPGLLLVTAFEALVVAPIFSADQGGYLSGVDWRHFRNVQIFGMNLYLPGVFIGNPLASANGSLWSLAVETTLYLLLPALGLLGLMNRWGSLATLMAFTAAYACGRWNGLDFHHQGPVLLQGVTLFALTKWGSYFFIGSAIWIWRDALRLDAGLATWSILVLFACRNTAGAEWASLLFGSYLIVFAGVGVGQLVPAYDRLGDLSYGIYIFSWPIQQWIVAINGNDIGPWRLAAYTMPIVTMIAFASWNLVEKPALGLKKVLGTSRKAAAETAETFTTGREVSA